MGFSSKVTRIMAKKSVLEVLTRWRVDFCTVMAIFPVSNGGHSFSIDLDVSCIGHSCFLWARDTGISEGPSVIFTSFPPPPRITKTEMQNVAEFCLPLPCPHLAPGCSLLSPGFSPWLHGVFRSNHPSFCSHGGFFKPPSPCLKAF